MTQTTQKTQDERIIDWNEERLLIKETKDLNIVNEMSFIIEEVIEGLTDTKSEDARKFATIIANGIATGELFKVLPQVKHENIVYANNKENLENLVDALGDIKVFATGTIRKAGYEPDLAMNEVLQEIESRLGSVQDGKFVKDKSPEAQAKWYKADFSKAKL